MLSDDISRFPTFKKIFEYTTKVSKTEEFLERLNQSVRHLKEYCQESFSADYIVDLTSLETLIEENDEKIGSILEISSVEMIVHDISISSLTLKYNEVTDYDLHANIQAILERIEELIV